jgi:hypothetical protein
VTSKKHRNTIPTAEDFARASAVMREQDRGLSDVRSIILSRFEKNGLHEMLLFYSADDMLVSYLFFATSVQMISSEQSGLTAQIKEAIIDELVIAGRGHRSRLKVIFEVDTHENVQKKYNGNYYKMLR